MKNINIMKKILMLLVGVLALSLTSCSPFALVNSQTFNNADLANYRTFRIVTPDEGKMIPGMTMVTYYNIAAAIREQMIMRGYTEDPNSPLLINIGLTVHREIDTEPAYMAYGGPAYGPNWGPYWGGYAPFYMYPYSYYWPTINPNAEVITGIYREGVLTMDFINFPEKLPLYTASVATILNNGEPQSYRNLQDINKAVQTLFSRFPVPLLPQYR